MSTEPSHIDKTSGKIRKVDRKGWPKLLRIPRVKAAISYWGKVGKITNKQFDLWLKEEIIDSSHYNDLPTLADHISNVLNKACGNKPLADGQDVGIHVAGYHQWADGQLRPTFFHVHNGHGSLNICHSWKETDDERHITGVFPQWKSEPRKLFERHQDFPNVNNTVERNLENLTKTYITRNGDYLIYSVIAQELERAFKYINLIPGISIPRDPDNLHLRRVFLHKILETIIWIYENSSKQPVVGGIVNSVAIGPNGYVLPVDKNIQ